MVVDVVGSGEVVVDVVRPAVVVVGGGEGKCCGKWNSDVML